MLLRQVALAVLGVLALGSPAPQEETAASGPNPDADADAHGWGYWGGYRGYYRPYGYWGRKKRSAEEETAASGPNPEAEADPWYGYGYRPYGWGGYYRPNGYGYWGRKKRSAQRRLWPWTQPTTTQKPAT